MARIFAKQTGVMPWLRHDDSGSHATTPCTLSKYKSNFFNPVRFIY
ncbi:hypothetical protein [Rickettsia endosymbiont of Orchestes rusci]